MDIDSPFNSPDDFPASAYAPLEQQLVALEALSTEKAQAANMIEFADMFRCRGKSPLPQPLALGIPTCKAQRFLPP